jgi:hypothetical protein
MHAGMKARMEMTARMAVRMKLTARMAARMKACKHVRMKRLAAALKKIGVPEEKITEPLKYTRGHQEPLQ